MYLSDQCLGIATCSQSCHPIFLLEEMEKKIGTLLDRAVTDMSVVILQKLGLRNVNDLSIHCVYREICTLQSFCFFFRNNIKLYSILLLFSLSRSIIKLFCIHSGSENPPRELTLMS